MASKRSRAKAATSVSDEERVLITHPSDSAPVSPVDPLARQRELKRTLRTIAGRNIGGTAIGTAIGAFVGYQQKKTGTWRGAAAGAAVGHALGGGLLTLPSIALWSGIGAGIAWAMGKKPMDGALAGAGINAAVSAATSGLVYATAPQIAEVATSGMDAVGESTEEYADPEAVRLNDARAAWGRAYAQDKQAYKTAEGALKVADRGQDEQAKQAAWETREAAKRKMQVSQKAYVDAQQAYVDRLNTWTHWAGEMMLDPTQKVGVSTVQQDDPTKLGEPGMIVTRGMSEVGSLASTAWFRPSDVIAPRSDRPYKRPNLLKILPAVHVYQADAGRSKK